MGVEVLTFGCRLNAVEGEAVRAVAEAAGTGGDASRPSPATA